MSARCFRESEGNERVVEEAQRIAVGKVKTVDSITDWARTEDQT